MTNAQTLQNGKSTVLKVETLISSENRSILPPAVLSHYTRITDGRRTIAELHNATATFGKKSTKKREL